MIVRDLHTRVLPRGGGGLIDSLAGPDDRLWPCGYWPRMRLDRPLAEGAVGGHGPVGYTVVGYVPGRWVRFRFTAPRGFDGFHEYTVHPRPDGQDELHHLLSMRTRGAARITWPLFWRPQHDALIEDSLDRAVAESAGRAWVPGRWSLWTRLLRRAGDVAAARRRSGRAAPTPTPASTSTSTPTPTSNPTLPGAPRPQRVAGAPSAVASVSIRRGSAAE